MENFKLVKNQAEFLKLTPEKIISGIRLFEGKNFIIVDEIVETKMEVLGLTLNEVTNLSTLFSYAKNKKVEFYFIIEKGNKKLRMKSTVIEKKNVKKDFIEELKNKFFEGQKRNSSDFYDSNDSFSDLFKDFFGGKF